jgi:GntR family transcriptional regulator, transcriptional repressor for pyruvate dehydrogenase complex
MKSTPVRIERKRLTDQIIEHLLTMISEGRFAPGDRLPPEHLLMKEFGVGRSSLREAVGALSLIGLLNVSPGRGTQVNLASGDFLTKPLRWGMLMMERNRIHELIEARIALEQALVGMAAERATEEDIKEIRHCHEQMRAAKKSKSKTIQADFIFHIALANAAHNSVLSKFLTELRLPVLHWMEKKASAIGEYDHQVILKQHDAILKAVESHDINRAQVALHRHLESVKDQLTTLLVEKRL